MIQFDCFIGLDQTGAVTASGKPKALPMAVLQRHSKHWSLTVQHQKKALKLSSLKTTQIRKEVLFAGRDLSKLAVIVDAVLGLPEKVFPFQNGGAASLHRLFQAANRFEYQKKSYGLQTAAQFFQQYQDSKNSSPARQAEGLAGANSIFRVHPYQRNIGCGSFRIWKDLGELPELEFHLGHFEKPDAHRQDKAWLFEAYPSLFWKTWLQSPTRKPEVLIQFLKKNSAKIHFETQDLRTLEASPDHADAAILALGALQLQTQKRFWDHPQEPFVQKEGWILGLKAQKP